MLDSFILSVFIVIFLWFAILFYPKFNLDFLAKGKNIRLSNLTVGLIIIATALIGLTLAALFIYVSGPQLLQFFYLGLYTFSWLITYFFLFNFKKILWRAVFSFSASLILLLIVLKFSSQFYQNLFMAGSLIWLGPVIFQKLNFSSLKKFKINFKLIIVILFSVAIIDAYNIYLSPSSGVYSDAGFFLNGMITFGNFSSGIGDIFLMYLIIGLTQKLWRQKPALILAFLLAFARFFLRLIPGLNNVVIPYYLIIVPITLIFWLIIYLINEQNTKSYEVQNI